MSSIRNIQTERALTDIVHNLLSKGIDPLLYEVVSRLSSYFADHPAGRALQLDVSNFKSGVISDIDLYNKIISYIAMNVDVLYDASNRQLEDAININRVLRLNLMRLQAKQKRIERTIDDHLLSQRNSEGYFATISDNFADLSLTDTRLTSARISTEKQTVTIPSISSFSSAASLSNVGVPNIRIRVDGEEGNFRELAPFQGALEASLDNILWAFEVESDSLSEVIAEVDIPVKSGSDMLDITELIFDPYGSTPVQVFVEARNNNGDLIDFGAKIQTGRSRMVFIDSPRSTDMIRLTLRKTEPDYSDSLDDRLRYKYIFGAKMLQILYLSYENSARFISNDLLVGEEGQVIDAVSLNASTDLPAGTNMTFYIASSDPETSGSMEFSDFVWHQIDPIGSVDNRNNVVRFGGANVRNKMIRDNPQGDELQLIPEKLTGPIQDRNPSPSIIKPVDIYKIAELNVDPILNSLQLLEGVNTTRIYSRSIEPNVLFTDLDIDYWAAQFNNNMDNINLDYGRIDTGNEFFYGGDIGMDSRDIYIETYLDSDRSYETFLAEFQKIDDRSRLWGVKVYLNGKILGELPIGVSKRRLSWIIREGLNHVVLLVRIPPSGEVDQSFLGSLSLFGDSPPLQSYGSVRLDRWGYVDPFTMKYNESGQPKTFTIKDNMIISRRKPTTNFQIRYATKTGEGPEAVRLRADLSRGRNNPNVTPQLNSYSLRFSYGT